MERIFGNLSGDLAVVGDYGQIPYDSRLRRATADEHFHHKQTTFGKGNCNDVSCVWKVVSVEMGFVSGFQYACGFLADDREDLTARISRHVQDFQIDLEGGPLECSCRVLYGMDFTGRPKHCVDGGLLIFLPHWRPSTVLVAFCGHGRIGDASNPRPYMEGERRHHLDRRCTLHHGCL